MKGGVGERGVGAYCYNDGEAKIGQAKNGQFAPTIRQFAPKTSVNRMNLITLLVAFQRNNGNVLEVRTSCIFITDMVSNYLATWREQDFQRNLEDRPNADLLRKLSPFITADIRFTWIRKSDPDPIMANIRRRINRVRTMLKRRRQVVRRQQPRKQQRTIPVEEDSGSDTEEIDMCRVCKTQPIFRQLLCAACDSSYSQMCSAILARRDVK